MTNNTFIHCKYCKFLLVLLAVCSQIDEHSIHTRPLISQYAYTFLWNTDSKEENKTDSVEQNATFGTDLSTVLNAWYSAGFYTGK